MNVISLSCRSKEKKTNFSVFRTSDDKVRNYFLSFNILKAMQQIKTGAIINSKYRVKKHKHSALFASPVNHIYQAIKM